MPTNPPKLYTIGRKTMTIYEWAELYDVPVARIKARLRTGMSFRQAVLKPVPEKKVTRGGQRWKSDR